jgi:hypothetical protein
MQHAPPAPTLNDVKDFGRARDKCRSFCPPGQNAELFVKMNKVEVKRIVHGRVRVSGLLPVMSVLRRLIAQSMGSPSAACYDSEAAKPFAVLIHLCC